jgi:hypothetical protein
MFSLVLMWRSHSWSLSKHFRNTLYFKNSWERARCGEICFEQSGRSKALHDYRDCHVDMIAFDTHSRFWNMLYQRVHTTETTAISRSWKKKSPIRIREPVSNVYILSVVLQPKWDIEWLFVEVPRSHTIRHTHTNTHTHTAGLLRMSDKLVA